MKKTSTSDDEKRIRNRQRLYASSAASDEEISEEEDDLEKTTPPMTSTPAAVASVSPCAVSSTSSGNTSGAPTYEDCCICGDPLVPSSIPATLPCKHTAHYNCLMGVQNDLCPLCRAPIPESLRQKIEVDEDPLHGSDVPLWQYASRDGKSWWYFLPEQSATLEEVYQRLNSIRAQRGRTGRDVSTVSLVIRGKTYVVDLLRMEQRSPDNAIRTVKRRDPTEEPENIRGIAGAIPKQ